MHRLTPYRRLFLLLGLVVFCAMGISPAEGQTALPINIGAGLDMVLDAPLDEIGDTEFELRAFELNIGAPVDPYFDMVTTIGYHDGEFEVEEAWASTILPGGIKLAMGREMIPFGYLNRVHEHDFPQIDQPYVIEGLVTDHGLIGDGGHLEYMAPFLNPTLTLNLGVYQQIGHSVGRRVEGFPVMGRMQTYFQCPESVHAILAGASYLTGAGDTDHMEGRLDENQRTDDRRALGKIQHLAGIDFKYQYSPVGRTYRGLTLAGELLYVDYDPYRNHVAYDQDPELDPGTDVGLYLYAHWNRDRFWGAGYRFDYTDPLFNAVTGAGKLTAHSVYGEWRGTEFSRIRLQYQYLSESGGDDAHRLMLQGTYFVGWHPPHRF